MKIHRPITIKPKDWESVDYPRPPYPVNVFVINPADPIDVFMTMHRSCDDAYKHYDLLRDDSDRALRQALRKWNLPDGAPGFFRLNKDGLIYLIQAIR